VPADPDHGSRGSASARQASWVIAVGCGMLDTCVHLPRTISDSLGHHAIWTRLSGSGSKASAWRCCTARVLKPMEAMRYCWSAGRERFGISSSSATLPAKPLPPQLKKTSSCCIWAVRSTTTLFTASNMSAGVVYQRETRTGTAGGSPRGSRWIPPRSQHPRLGVTTSPVGTASGLAARLGHSGTWFGAFTPLRSGGRIAPLASYLWSAPASDRGHRGGHS
jgi:hypothetical protein